MYQNLYATLKPVFPLFQFFLKMKLIVLPSLTMSSARQGTWVRAIKHKYKVSIKWVEGSPEDNFGGIGWQEALHELEMYLQSRKPAGLLQKKYGQLGKGGKTYMKDGYKFFSKVFFAIILQ